MPTVTAFVVMQVRQAPQQALSAGVMSALLLRSGSARVCARSSMTLIVGEAAGEATSAQAASGLRLPIQPGAFVEAENLSPVPGTRGPASTRAGTIHAPGATRRGVARDPARA